MTNMTAVRLYQGTIVGMLVIGLITNSGIVLLAWFFLVVLSPFVMGRIGGRRYVNN